MNYPGLEPIPPEYEAELRKRIHEHVACELKGDVEAVYNFTLPSIREKRIAEYDFEPEYSLGKIRKYLNLIKSAAVDSIEIEFYSPFIPRHSNNPGAVVKSKVIYNNISYTNRTIWILFNDTWYTTALYRMAWPKDC